MGLMLCDESVARKAEPSGALRPPAPEPMAPPAPPRFSMNTACPRPADKAGCTIRVMMSTAPPGGKETTRRIGLAGYCWASVDSADARRSASVTHFQNAAMHLPPQDCGRV